MVTEFLHEWVHGGESYRVNRFGVEALGPGGRWQNTGNRQAVAAELARLAARVRELERALRDLLASADASWENSGSKSGHDWADACKSARTALEPKP